jgi:hypothetical protein
MNRDHMDHPAAGIETTSALLLNVSCALNCSRSVFGSNIFEFVTALPLPGALMAEAKLSGSVSTDD